MEKISENTENEMRLKLFKLYFLLRNYHVCIIKTVFAPPLLGRSSTLELATYYLSAV